MIKFSKYCWKLQSQFLVAIQNGDTESCSKLLATNGVDCDTTFNINSQVQTGICLGVQRGLYQIVKLLIQNGCSINRRTSNGATALHIAVENGYTNIMMLLLENKADVSTTNSLGQTPLHVCCRRGSLELVKILILYGSEINRRDNEGKTPLALACAAPNFDPEIIRFLVNNGAEVNYIDRNNSTPLLYALNSPYFNFETVRILIENSPSLLDHLNREGLGAIHLVMQSQSIHKWDCLNLLLNTGCNVNLANHMGQTPVHLGCIMKDVRSLRILVCAGANPNSIDKLGISPLNLAVISGNNEIINLLIMAGAKEGLKMLANWDFSNLSNDEKQDLIAALTNPLTLKDLARISICKYFNPQNISSLNNLANEIPQRLVPYLLFERF